MTIHEETNSHILVDVWEAYERDTDNSVAYLFEEDARNSTFFDEIDLVAPARVWLHRDCIEDLASRNPIY